MKRKSSITFPRGLGKSPVSFRPEIVRLSCSSADSWETGLPNGYPGRGPGRAFRNPAPAVAAIPDWPTNHGLCSSRAIELSRRNTLGTSPSSYAICAPACRSNFWGFQPQLAILMRTHPSNCVHTHTVTRNCHIFSLVIRTEKALKLVKVEVARIKTYEHYC